MFKSARLKLTLWYLVIIALISSSFSLAIYKALTSELDRVERMQKLRVERGIPERFRNLDPNLHFEEIPNLFSLDTALITETKDRLKLILMLINLGILGTSALAGYFLAGRTLRPIAVSIEDQKRFVADASHELRTPLTSIKTEIEVALRDKNLKLTEARKYLESNLEEVDRMDKLASYLLTLTRYQNDGSQHTFEDLDLKNIVNNVVHKLTPIIEKNKIKIDLNLSRANIKGNKIAIGELVTILIDNAIKYSREGSVIEISLKDEGNLVNLLFKDYGVGIKQTDLPYIFDRFYRGDTSRSGESGFGLGLSIAQKIVQLHKGTITVKSQISKGSLFKVTLPKHSSASFQIRKVK